MSEEKSRFIVSADWVEKNLSDPKLRLVDAAWYLPAQNRNGAEEYAAGHIPGAVFFDQDVIADHAAPYPHTIPSPEFFAAEVGKLGISDTDTIVVYDGPGIFTAPRVWFLFRTMGAANVFVMDGGSDGWKRDGRPLTTELPEPLPATFNARFNSDAVTSFDGMRDIVERGQVQIADARSPGRFEGTEPEPRQGVRSGHMPGAHNLPSSVFSTGGHFKSLPDLKTTLEGAGLDLSKPVVTSCGSGITAAIITLALQSLGHTDNTLNDGSWTEWGSRKDTPVVTGRNEEA